MVRTLRVGLIGCGTIGTQLALALQRHYRHAARIVALHDLDPRRAAALQRRLTNHPPLVPLSTLIRRSQLVIEAASVDVAARVVTQALRANRDVFIMSVGGLLGNQAWQRLARRSRARVFVPSGALAGLDGVKAMAVGTLRRVTLTSRKPPRALATAPYVTQRRLRLGGLRRPRLLFEGSPRAVVKRFPQNTNVAAALMLAAGPAGARATIRVIADPTIRVNIHELELESDCGRLRCQIQSRPSTNPKTSELAVRSAIATLPRIFDSVSIGT